MVTREKHRTRWTPQDYAQLRRLIGEGLTARSVAFEMRRTTEAIQHQASKLKLSFRRTD